MFWKYNFISGSNIDTLLEKENVTLKELLSEDDILQECKAQTKKLIDYLVKPEILEEMVSMITQEPPLEEDGNEQLRYRYSNRACELLTFDIDQINDGLVNNEVLIDKLYNFLKIDEPLNTLLASFFSKTMGLLIAKQTEAIFYYMKDKDFISLLLKHLDTSAVMDLLMRFIVVEDSAIRSKLLKWLDQQKLIQQLVSRIDCEYSKEFNCNASNALCEIIKLSREYMSMQQEKADPNPLLDTIESVEVIQDLLNHMFKNVQNESAIVNGIAVLLQLLVFKKQGSTGVPQMSTSRCEQQPLVNENVLDLFSSMFRHTESEQMSTLDAERLAHGVHNVITAVTPRLEDFRTLFLKPPTKPPIMLTIGCLDPPLGLCRLEVARLLTALLYTNNHLVNVKLAELESIIILMNMFFQYSWNNFLHTQVEQTIERIITNSPTVDSEINEVHPLLDQLFVQYKITEKILECFEDSEKPAARKGYMGHLTKIANHIAQNIERGINSSLIKEKMSELPEDHQKKWDEFVAKKLAKINEKNKVINMVGFIPAAADGDSVEFRDVPFGKDTSVHLAFSDYQMHEMTNNFADQFGFNDEFMETDDGLVCSMNHLKNSLIPLSQNFQTSECSAELFEEVCRGKISSVTEGVLWGDSESSPTAHPHFSQNEENTSDSDEESQVFESPKCKKPQVFESQTSNAPVQEEVKMDVDNQEVFGSVAMDIASAQASNPWQATEAPNPADDSQGNWADFSNFASFGSSSTPEGFDANASPSSNVAEASEVKFPDQSNVPLQQDKKFP